MMGSYIRTLILSGLMIGLILGCRASSPAAETVRPTETDTAETPGQESEPPTATPTELLATTTPLPTETPLPMPTPTPTQALTLTESTDDPAVVWTDPLTLPDIHTTDFPAARSVDLALAEAGTVYVALGLDNHIYVARSTDYGHTFAEPVPVAANQPALMLSVERPAIAATEAGQVSVGWTSPEMLSNIWYALSTDGGQTFGPAQQINDQSQPETIMARLTLDAEDNPAAAWLENGTLRLARSFDQGQTFATNQLVDDQICECCHPQIVIERDRIFLAYRNREIDDAGQHTRDIFFSRSVDGGQSFETEVRVSDAHWPINACPISGPSLLRTDGRLYLSWMDGRHDEERNFSRTDIWLATSDDDGQTFSPNQRINPTTDVYNNLPSLAVDAGGELHIIWQAEEPAGNFIYYGRSQDAGLTFAGPAILVSSTDGQKRRRPGNASLAIGPDDTIYVSWVDALGAHLATWQNP